MRVGFCGLGKLGLPIATSIAFRGFDVLGYDINPAAMSKGLYLLREGDQHGTGDFNTMLTNSPRLKFASSMEEIANNVDAIIVCVATPHDKEYEGITCVPNERKDFDYTYLVKAVKTLAKLLTKDTVIAIISTVLPGTLEREIKPLLTDYMKLVYTPQTPAMGTAVRDFLYPEFYILGVDDDYAANVMEDFYHKINPTVSVRRMSIASAELCKVVYNTYITMKISYAQTLMEIAHKMNEDSEGQIDVDDITDTLKIATNRLVSTKYMTAGMQDGGGCHPRDLIALSWLSRDLDLSYDLFGQFVECREEQMRWMATLVADQFDMMDGDFDNIEPCLDSILIIGTSFKQESNITTGSSALLVKSILEEWGYKVTTYVPYVDVGQSFGMTMPGVVLIGMNHDEFRYYEFPERTVIIDPFRYMPDQEGRRVIRVGQARG